MEDITLFLTSLLSFFSSGEINGTPFIPKFFLITVSQSLWAGILILSKSSKRFFPLVNGEFPLYKEGLSLNSCIYLLHQIPSEELNKILGDKNAFRQGVKMEW